MNYCIDCAKEISPKAIRCNSCNNKGDRNPFYKGEKSLKNAKKFCIQCNKILYWRNNSGLCGSCVKKEKYFGKKVDKNKCIDCGIEIVRTSLRCKPCYSKYNSGPNNHFFGKTFKHTEESKKKISEAAKKRQGKNHPLYGKKRPDLTGCNHYNWKGGTRALNKEIRMLLEYREWRRCVFERDGYICQICNQRGGTLNADHIKPYSIIIQENNITNITEAIDCEELWDVNNGRTLCVNCHRETPTYGNRFDLLLKK